MLQHIRPHSALIVPLANGEPTALLDAIEAAAAREEIEGVTVHQMHALRDRPYLHGQYGDRLRHVSYFLSHITRPCYQAGTVDLVPNHFSEVFSHMSGRTHDPLVIAAAAPPDRERSIPDRRCRRRRRAARGAGSARSRGRGGGQGRRRGV